MRIPYISLLAAGALALGGCAYGGYYGDYGYGYPYYGAGFGYGYGYDPFGWYGDYYYPGTGIYVYDSGRNRHVWNDRQRHYWTTRETQYRTRTGRTWSGENWSGFNHNGTRHHDH
jgi:hypothetical protein